MKNQKKSFDNHIKNENHRNQYERTTKIMKILEINMRITKIMKILEVNVRIMKIMKIKEIHVRITKIMKINDEKHENQ